MFNFTANTLILLILSSCANFSERSFSDVMDKNQSSFFSPGDDFQVVGGDRSLHISQVSRYPASRSTLAVRRRNKSLVDELNGKIEQLSDREYLSFQRYTPYFSGISEQLYYLSLSKREKSKYLDQFKVKVSSKQRKNSRTIYQSMTKRDVLRLWGRPGEVHFSGNPKNENEKWVFLKEGKKQLIYFESGKVEGWSIDY